MGKSKKGNLKQAVQEEGYFLFFFFKYYQLLKYVNTSEIVLRTADYIGSELAGMKAARRNYRPLKSPKERCSEEEK